MKKYILFIMIFLLSLQFYQPNKTRVKIVDERDFFVSENVPKSIAEIFKKSCYDCHSDQTKYMWYDYIAPLSWYVDSNIKRAKLSLNFSRWKDFEPWQRRLFLQGAIIYDVKTDKMPPKDYLLMHPEGKISKSEKKEIESWLATIEYKGKNEKYRIYE